jgi:hypothetical protein
MFFMIGTPRRFGGALLESKKALGLESESLIRLYPFNPSNPCEKCFYSF